MTIDPLGLARCASCGNAFEADRQPDGACGRCGGVFDAPAPASRQRAPVSFRDAVVEVAIDARCGRGLSRGQVAARDAGRYYALLAAELRRIDLSLAEASLCCDALNGLLADSLSAPLAWANVEDAVEHDGLAEKWEVDGPALVARLRTPGASVAVVDAVEQFWANPEGGEAALRRVGLIR